MAFSENLQYLRARDNLTQEQLAERLNVSRQSVSKWEGGQSFPEMDTILRLCDVHQVPYATNAATAEVIIMALDRGDLDWREMIRPRNTIH